MNRLDLKRFDAVAFDVEGTLADTIPTHHAARLEAFGKHGYGHITPEQHALGTTYGSVPADIIGGILHAAGEIREDGPFKHHSEVKEVIATKGAIFETMAANGFVEMPGAADFVHSIAAQFAGHMALVTSSRERFVLPFLKRYGIGGYFPHDRIISEDTIEKLGKACKPSPDPYLLAMQRLDTKNLLVFEDTVPGVLSAKAAGATVIAVNCDSHNLRRFQAGDLPHSPDAIVRDYAEARTLLGL